MAFFIFAHFLSLIVSSKGSAMSFSPIYNKRSSFALSFLSLLASTAPVFANPEGGVVAAGSADIVATGATLNVHQYSNRAVIDWRSFNISPSELTEFHQPSTGSIIVNRVNDANPSQIMGALRANGNVVIINPSGVMFGRDSQVDVGGLIATTLDVRNDEVMAGGALKFTKVSGVTGRVVNEGQITAREAGLVGLVADSVENSGIIRARMGRAILASGDVATVDFQGDGLLSLEVADDSAKRLIRHSGTIEAAGGDVLLTAAAGRTIVDNLIEVSGEIKTPSIGRRNGRIVISAAGINRTTRTGSPSKVMLSGTLSARGQAAGETGGSIQILADTIEVKNTAQVLADGVNGGGSINIGGSFQGGLADADYTLLSVRRPELENLQAAHTVVVENGAEIDASATENGNGGDIVLWADNAMYFYGTSRARGGKNSGDGGFVETSGKHYLDYRGQTDTRADNGDVGLLLLDPTNITISNAADQNSGVGPYSPTGDDVTSILNVTTLQNAMNANDVIVQTRASGSQLGDINVNTALSVYDGDEGYTLTMLAAHDININATMDYSGYGHFNFTAGHDINVNSAISSAGNTTLNATNNVVLNADVATNYLGLYVGNDVVVNANITSYNNYIDTLVANRSLSLGNNTGSINLDSAELAYFTNKNFYVGEYSTLGDVTLAGSGLGYVSAKSSSGSITTIGNQSFTSGFNFRTDTLNLGGTINGGAGGVGISTVTNGTSLGVGDGTGGTLHLSSADLAGMSGAAGYSFGSNSVAASVTVAANNWTGGLNLSANNSNINITGNQTVASGSSVSLSTGSTGGSIDINGNISGADYLSIQTGALQLGGDISGSGTLSIVSYDGSDMGFGTGAAGTFQLDDTELAHIQDGWSNINIYSAGNLTMNAHTWADKLQVAADNITVNGAQNMGANDLSMTINTADLALNAAIIGTGKLDISTPYVSASLAGSSGAFNLSAAELDNIQDGWSQITILGASDVSMDAYNWKDILEVSASSMAINGAQNMGANDLTLVTYGGDLALNGALTGSGTLTIEGNIATTSIAGSSGAFNLSTTELNNIQDGWSQINLGDAGNGAAMTLGAYTWLDPVKFMNGFGTLTVSGDQNFGTNNAEISTNRLLDLNANLIGTGQLTLSTALSSTATVIGATTPTSAFRISAADITSFLLGKGWSSFVIGSATQTGAITVSGARSWNADLALKTKGIVTINGAAAQGVGAHNLTIETDANPAINAALSGTGIFTVTPISTTNASKTIGLAGGSGVINFTTTELNNISNGWSKQIYGRTDQVGAITMGAQTWTDPTYFLTSGGIDLQGNQTSSDASGDTTKLVFAGGSYFYNGGGNTIDPGTGRYLIYSPNPSADTYGGLTPTTKRYNKTYAAYGPASVTETGNVFLYSVAPTLNITVDDVTHEYGLTNPVFTYTVTSGLIDGDLAGTALSTATVSSVATAATNVGTASITGSFLSDMGYQINSVTNGTLSITKAMLTATADAKTREYGLTNPALTVAYTGFRNADTAAVIDTAATAATAATALSNVGNYAITASGAIDNNYAFTYVGGSLAVTQATLTATADNQIREYGLTNPALTVSYTGFRNGDTSAVIDTAVTAATAATNLSNIGSYAITASGALDNNYAFTYVGGNLVVSPKSILVNVPAQAMHSFGTPQPYVATYSGFVNGDTDSLITQIASVQDTAGNYTTPGIYQIIPYGALIGSTNYSLSYLPSDLTIASVVPDSVSRVTSSPTLLLGQNDLGQSLSGVAGFSSQTSNANGSSSIEEQGSYDLVPIGNTAEGGSFLSPVSNISIQVERDLALILGL